jgi:arabinose-5-phosphate isomerase
MDTEPHIKNARLAVDIEIEALLRARDLIGVDFSRAVELIRNKVGSGRVVVMGVGKSGHVGKKIASTLSSTGTPAIFVHPAEAGHGDLGMITSQDVVVAISQSGRSEELIRVMPYLKRHNIRVIAFSGDSNSELVKQAGIFIDTSVLREACPLGLAPTASTTVALALGDALAVCLLKAANFTATDFASTHPHGKLGRRLLLAVGDIMTDMKNAPLVQGHMKIKDSLCVMSSGAMGFLIVLDDIRKPIGVFTDGDLRRTLDRDFDIRGTAISEVMTKDFSAIKGDQLAVVAVELMERKKISALPVVDDHGYVTGAINMRQIIQAGVI